jgi:hypothetical protein
LLALALVITAGPLAAQSAGDHRAAVSSSVLPLLGGSVEEGLRLRQLLGDTVADGFLHRSLSTQLAPPREEGGLQLAVLGPALDLVWNSDLPFSLNQGPLWAGRGLNAMLIAGARLAYGRFDIVLAPQFTYSENLDFQILPRRDPLRSQFASPWHLRDQSADLPLRFGDAPLALLHPGQSSVTVRAGGLRFGAASENEWWGPGIRNAIVMSSNAEGFPRVFLATDAPRETAIGSFEGRWILGALTESLFFDRLPENDLRSLSGAIVSYRPRWEPDLTIGLSRVVYAATDDRAAIAGNALDVFTWWEHQVVPPDSTIRDPARLQALLADLPPPHPREQMLSLFGRWILPGDGVEVYAEWARVALPTSLRDLVSEPHHSQGYTVGLQWARPLRDRALLRLQAELTNLEESSTFNNRPVPGFYVSGGVPQGYTHRGRTIGAAIGPGASSQWLSSDHLAPRWRLGFFFGRIRWDNDVYFRGRNRLEVGHDVSLFGGVRAGVRLLGSEVIAELTPANRYNYLFQNALLEPGGEYAVDRRNFTFRLSVAPAR